MAAYVQLDLKAVEQAAIVASAGGISLHQQLAGIAQLFHYVFTKKSDRASPELLMGCFGVARAQLERLIDAEIAFGHLAQIDGESSSWRIRGAKRYFRLKQALSKGGHKAKGNLKQYSGAQQPAAPQQPTEPEVPPARKKKSSGPSELELDCWAAMERARREHCIALGMEPGESKPLKNSKLLKAVMAVGLVDGDTLTRFDLLTVLFERYLAQERLGLKDREGTPCTPPWPIDLFLATGVLERFKQDYDAEDAA